MKHDTQHLDYLISQYVDGCLDPASRKSLEQQLVHNPSARELYKGHRDVQDMLDDWGNRIPMIDWDDFDKKLAGRLENETVGGDVRSSLFRRLRPLAAAAALFLAVGVGYAWRAFSTTPTLVASAGLAVHDTPAPSSTSAVFEGQNTPLIARKSSFFVNDAPGITTVRASNGLVVVSPEDPAVKPPKDAVKSVPNSIERSAAVDTSQHGSVSARIPAPAKNDNDNKEPGPAFP